MKAHYLIALIGLVLLSCKDQKKEVYEDITTKTKEGQWQEGFLVLNTNCFSCHSPDPDNADKVAPNIQELKLAYLEKSSDAESFQKHLVAFLKNPSKDMAIIPEAIDTYGTMPEMAFSEEQLNALASYMFFNEVEAENWYTKQFPLEKEKYLKPNLEEDPLKIGKNIAMQTKSVLGKNLLNAIKTKGTEGAVSFCSTRAIPLTDSMGIALNATIKRVSDLNRNPDNAANIQELDYIIQSKWLLEKDQALKPLMHETENKVVCYYPITTNAMCLQCHGQKNTNIQPKTYTKIKSLYPEDRAIGYGENELRGIWVIEMDKNTF